MKKTTKIILGSLLVLGLIGGCTEEETEQQEEQVKTEQQEEKQEEEVVEEEVVVEEEKPKTMQEIFMEQGVSQEKADEMVNTLRDIAGNNNFIIKLKETHITDGSGRFTASIMQGDGWLDEGISLNCTVFEGEIRLVNSGDYQFYNKEEGGLQFSYAETILTQEEAVEFRTIAEQVMTTMAQNPGTVGFEWFTTKNVEQRTGNEVLIQGVMTCQNALGMELKYLYQVKLDYNTGALLSDPYYEQTR